jgi:hypothetical protein
MGGMRRFDSKRSLQSEGLLALGDRVRMSALGRSRHPKYGGREGLIVGQVSTSGRRVRFDGLRTVQNHRKRPQRGAPKP